MATLTGNSIQSSYQGLLKTESNGAIGAGNILLTDGEGNSSKLTINTGVGSLQVEGPFNPNHAVKQTTWTKTSYPMGVAAGQRVGLSMYDQNGALTSSITQDRYGSLYYMNTHGDNAEGHVFRSTTGAGGYAPAVIRMNTYNGINNSNNWFTGYNQSVTDLQVSGDQLTLSRQGALDLTVTLPTAGVTSIIAGSGIAVDQATGDVTITATGGGGGGGTVAMTSNVLNPVASHPTNKSWKNGETVIGYLTVSIDCGGGFTPWKLMPMQEGEEINELYFNVKTAGTDPTTTVQIGIYELVTAPDGDVVMGDLLKDCGNINVSTTGDKFVDISSAPFVMPAGSTYGSVGIMIGNNNGVDPISIAGWQNGSLNSPWNNGVSQIAAGTVYRAIRREYNGWPADNQLPANASNRADYDSNTNNPLMLLVR